MTITEDQVVGDTQFAWGIVLLFNGELTTKTSVQNLNCKQIYTVENTPFRYSFQDTVRLNAIFHSEHKPLFHGDHAHRMQQVLDFEQKIIRQL